MTPWVAFEDDKNIQKITVEQDPASIKWLVESYNQKMPPSFQSYQEGVQAGIRYALLALNVKVNGINKREGSSDNEKR